jgi:hypothetical protein
MSHIQQYYPIFSYFADKIDQPLDWWTDKKVLDFGGNHGNVLRDPTCTIKHKNYHCLDISLSAIEKGKEDFPNAHWYHYNRFNIAYNFNGNKDEPFPIFKDKFDIILIYSVFTSTSKTEMVRCINEELLPLLSSDGILINTYLSLDDSLPLNAFLHKRCLTRSVSNIIRNQVSDKEYVYLMDNNTIIESEEEFLKHNQSWSLSFYRDDKIKQLFPTCEIKPFQKNIRGRTDLIHHTMLICPGVS